MISMKLLLFTWAFIVNCLFPDIKNNPGSTGDQLLLVRRCNDFTLSGKGDHPEWTKAKWHQLKKLDPEGDAYETKFKILYSATGIYVLFNGKDSVVSTQYDQDFGDLYKGDVFEVFFHTEPKQPIYFEYEINQLSKELVLLIPRFTAHFQGWVPWHYEKSRVVKKAVSVEGGKGESNAAITSWSAELFFPYDLLKTLSNVPPASGTVWNANFYRLDYDNGSMVKWAWSPVKTHFHEYENFGAIQFE